LAEREDSGGGEIFPFLVGVEGNAGEELGEGDAGAERVEEDAAVSGGEFYGTRIFVDDGPSGGAGAFPEGVFLWVLGDEVAGFFTEVGDGSGVGGGEGATWVAFFKVGHGLGEEGGKAEGIFGEDALEGEAALLVEEADVAGGEVGGFGRGVIDEGDADAVAVSDEGGFERAE